MTIPRRRRLAFPVFLLLSLATVAATAGLPASQALTGCRVASGYDVFTTDSEGTTLGVQALAGTLGPLFHYRGVPLGSFSFGALGQRDTGPADTVVVRLADGTSQTPVVPVQLVGLQLASVESVGGVQHFITLQSARTLADVARADAAQPALGPGQPSLGTLALTFNEDCSGGTLDSLFAVAFDVRVGSVTGPIVASATESISSTSVPWSHLGNVPRQLDEQGRLAVHRVQDALQHIQGVDYLLNGVDESTDFHPGFPLPLLCGASSLDGPTGSFPPPASSGAAYGGATTLTFHVGANRVLALETVYQVSGPTTGTLINHFDAPSGHVWEFHGGDFNVRGFDYRFHTVCLGGADEDFSGGPITVYN